MKVRELMSSLAHSCRPADSLARAAQLLREHDCGMLPVVDDSDRVTWTVTDRDVCRGAFRRERRLTELRVADSMSRAVATCTADEDVAAVAQRMAEHDLDHLPVVDERGCLRGIVSRNVLALAVERDADARRTAARPAGGVLAARA